MQQSRFNFSHTADINPLKRDCQTECRRKVFNRIQCQDCCPNNFVVNIDQCFDNRDCYSNSKPFVDIYEQDTAYDSLLCKCNNQLRELPSCHSAKSSPALLRKLQQQNLFPQGIHDPDCNTDHIEEHFSLLKLLNHSDGVKAKMLEQRLTAYPTGKKSRGCC